MLLGDVVRSSGSAGIWTLQTSIFPENAASVRLHEACGFRVVGVHSASGASGAGATRSSSSGGVRSCDVVGVGSDRRAVGQGHGAASTAGQSTRWTLCPPDDAVP